MPEFLKIAPYLANPLVLIGFGLLLFFGIHSALLKARLLVPLSQNQSSSVVGLILKHGFWVAILIVVLGFGYAGLRAYHDAHPQQVQQGPITQQTGPCGSNIVGDNNQANVNCVDKAARTK
jgi:hypothetical protein